MIDKCEICNKSLAEVYNSRREDHDQDRGLSYVQKYFTCKKCDVTVHDSEYGVKIFPYYRGDVQTTPDWIDNLLEQGILLEGRC